MDITQTSVSKRLYKVYLPRIYALLLAIMQYLTRHRIYSLTICNQSVLVGHFDGRKENASRRPVLDWTGLDLISLNLDYISVLFRGLVSRSSLSVARVHMVRLQLCVYVRAICSDNGPGSSTASTSVT